MTFIPTGSIFLDQDRLFYLAYEKVKVVDEGKLEVHFWSYRPQICLEHLKSAVQAGNECKILDTFLQNVSVHSSPIAWFVCLLFLGTEPTSYTIHPRHCKTTAVYV